MNVNANKTMVVLNLLPKMVEYIKTVEHSINDGRVRKHMMVMGMLETEYNRHEQSVAWEDIEDVVANCVPHLVGFYFKTGEFKGEMFSPKDLEDLNKPEEPDVDDTGYVVPEDEDQEEFQQGMVQQYMLGKWVDAIPVYNRCVPNIEPDLDALPQSLQEAINEGLMVQ